MTVTGGARALCGAAALAAALTATAVSVGENVIRTDFAGDGVGGILDWSVCRSLGGVVVERLDEKGPAGEPVLRLSGGNGSKFSFDHTQSTVVPGERYRIGAFVRTKGLDPEKLADLHFYSGGWRWSARVALPRDTTGAWQRVTWEGQLRESPGGGYTLALHTAGLPRGAWIDISSPSAVALDEAGAKGLAPRPAARPFVARITPVEPLLCEIDRDIAWIDFFYPGDLAGEPAGYEIVATAGGRTARAPLDARRHAKAVFGRLPEGRHALAVRLVEKATGRTRAANDYSITVRAAIAETRGNRLNNFVTEIVREPLADGDYAFTLARDGWVHIGFGGSFAGVTADIDGAADPGAVAYRPGERSQAQRRLKAGRHVVTVKGAAAAKGAGVLSVRKVKVMVQGFGRTAFGGTDIGRFGAYGPDFYRRFGVLSFCNTCEIPDWICKAAPEFPADLRSRGCQVIGSLALGSRSPIRNDLAAFRRKIADHPAWRRGEPIVIDENAVGAPTLMKYNSAEVLWDVGRGHRIDVCLEDPVRCTFGGPAREIPELSALVNAGDGTSCILPETYIATMEREEDVEAVIDYWRDFSRRAGALVPAAPGRLVYLMSGWVWPGVFNPWYSPECDIRAYYGIFIHALATDPAFADIGGIGFSTPACDEGVFRFVAAAINHYGIEGSTERLNDRYRLRYHPGIMDNGDFTEGFAGWTARPAEAGSVMVGHEKGFGRSAAKQLRQYNAYLPPDRPYGDDFAVFRRSAAGANALERTLRNLEPGRVYEVTWCSYDVADIERPGSRETPDTLVRASVSDAETFPELGYDCGADRNKVKAKDRVATVTHRRVFRAKAPEARLVFTDDGAEAKPGARRAINWVGARPFFAASDADFEEVRRFGASRGRKRE